VPAPVLPGASAAGAEPPLGVLLLPDPLERFALRAQAEDLLRAEGVVAVDPARVPYSAFARMPEVLGDALAARQARRLVRALRRRRGRPRVVAIFDPLQYQLARAVLAAAGDPCELWYGPLAPPEGERAERFHDLAAQRAALLFTTSEDVAGRERAAGRVPVLIRVATGGQRATRAADEPLWQGLAGAGVDVRVTR
jgi:hypothetical protein